MTLTRGLIRNAVTTPLDARLMDMARHVANADGSPRAGVLGGANASIVSTTATMNVAIAAAEFGTTKGKADGLAVFTNDGTVNVAIATSPASNSRIDVIYVKHNDDTTGDANALPIFGVSTGAAAAAPTKPAIPTGALELATLRVYSGTTATNGGSNTLVNTYQMTAARGGRVAFRTKVDLDLWTTAVEGQDAVALASGGLYVFTAGVWVGTNTAFAVGSPIKGAAPDGVPLLTQAGQVVVTTDTAGNATITFPKAFPNGLISFSAIDGDPNPISGQRNFGILVGSANTTLGAARITVRSDTGAAIISASVRVVWQALGC